MNKKLITHFRFKSHRYATPNQPWMCGHREKPCELGPNSKGKCTVTFECQPIKKGDSWVCNRARKGSDACPCPSGPSPTGVCGQAITPCTPRPSLALCLKRANWIVFTLVATIILLSFGMEDGGHFASPGPLTQAHSQGESDCQMCHTESGTGAPINWFVNSNTNLAHAGMSQLNCVKCHDYGSNAFSPHSLSQRDLIALREERGNPAEREKINPGLKLGLLRTAFDLWSPGGTQTELNCAHCHFEHQGRTYDLKQMSSSQCQVCHEQAFPSFSNGHPSFGSYPFTEPARIIFNHKSHFEDHFTKGDHTNASNCLNCHAVDQKGEHVNVLPFSQSCAQCHADEVSPSDPDATKLPILRVPLVDIDTLDSLEHTVGSWPDDWDSLETTFPPATLLLLSSSLPEDVIKSFWETDVDVLEEDHLDQAQQFLWGYKEFLVAMRTNGATEINQRLAASLGRSLTEDESNDLKKSFPREAVLEMIDAWFPEAIHELTSRAAGEAPASSFQEDMEDRLSFDPKALTLGWYRSDTDLTLYYQPTRHEDTFMKLLLEAAQKNTLAGRELLKQIGGTSDTPKTGRCLKCHSEAPDASAGLHWSAQKHSEHKRPITRFSHIAHFRNVGMLDENGCYTCHTLNPDENSNDFLQSFHYFNSEPSTEFVGNFTAIAKESCAECHRPDHAGDNCLTCHNYHVGEFPNTDQTSRLIQSIATQSK